MRDRTNLGHTAAYLPTDAELLDVDGRFGDTWPSLVLGVNSDGVALEILRPDGRRIVRRVDRRRVDFVRPANASPAGSLAATHVITPIPTMHSYQGDLSNVATGTPNTPTPNAMVPFGQVNVHADLTLAVIHAHWIIVPAGGGDVVIELWRARNVIAGPISWFRLGVITSSPTGVSQTFAFDGVVPPTPELARGDYLFAQLTSKNNSFEGLTVDYHYVQPA